MVDNLGNQLVDACEHIGLIGEAITSTFELLDLTVDALYRSVRVGRFGGVNGVNGTSIRKVAVGSRTLRMFVI